MSAEFALINQLIRGWFDNRGQFCRSLLGGRGGSPREGYPCTPGIAGIPPQSAPPPPHVPGPTGGFRDSPISGAAHVFRNSGSDWGPSLWAGGSPLMGHHLPTVAHRRATISSDTHDIYVSSLPFSDAPLKGNLPGTGPLHVAPLIGQDLCADQSGCYDPLRACLRCWLLRPPPVAWQQDEQIPGCKVSSTVSSY